MSTQRPPLGLQRFLLLACNVRNIILRLCCKGRGKECGSEKQVGTQIVMHHARTHTHTHPYMPFNGLLETKRKVRKG
jgi:hypothetical protein